LEPLSGPFRFVPVRGATSRPTDLLWALHYLFPSEATLETIAARFGYSVARTAVMPRRESSGSLESRQKGPEPRRKQTEATLLPGNPLPSRLEPVIGGVTTPSTMPEWVAASPVIAVPTEPRTMVYEQPVAPLFRRSLSRALLSAAAAAWLDLGEIDILRILQAVLRIEPLTALPRRLVPSLARGLQVLLDAGLAMEPYARDVADLAAAMGRLAGTERVELVWFDACPRRGVIYDDPFATKDWRPPPPGVPVLAVSNLGLGPTRTGTWPAAASRDWELVAQRLVQRRSSLTGVVPFPVERAPRSLRRLARLVQWDRNTGVSTFHTRL
jgi:hypothetical protein